ncbi:hypothetical protein Ctob_011283 [Chrysochromulina tobinii]|uniref:Uncharacterized protein n=1 Tax=Chrysochromulina tobinii TaxID=1460289 RepID=A0A0M0JU06_9EUKA|nr:hypothetical protein Ctob_011283 [Chrysochromulina tobinii]|eukprot:KOO29832.1 hypothetical protein Ctob_011283 [Chrysochromulina sp. CCMP291]
MAAHVSLVSLFLVLSAEGVRVGTDSSLLVPSGITSSSGSLSSAAGSLRPDFSHVALTYLGRERVLAFDQWTGEHALWSLERNEVSKCDAFMWPPLSAGRWAALRYHEFVFVGFTQLIALDPSTGKLTLTECDDSAFLPRCHGEALRCSPLFEHTLAPLQPGHAAIHELTYLGRELLLHYDRTSGRYEVLRIRRAAEPSPTGARANGTASAANGGAAVGIQLERLPYTHLMDKTSCLKCSGGGAELRGGAMAALAACGECAVLQASLGQGAILPADALGQDGLLSHLAQFVLQTLRTEACARVLSTGCVLLGGSSAFRLQAATAAPIQPPLVPVASAAQVEKKDALTNGTNGTGSSAANATEAEEEVPPTFAFSLQVRLGSTADLAAAASTAVPYAVLHLVIAAPSAGFDDQTDDEGSGAEVGTLLLTSVALSLAPSNASDVALALPPVEALESPIMAPLQLDARAFLAYATPAFDPTASRRGITPLAGALPAASAALAFGTHELIYLGYDAILDYVPASAAMAVHQLDAGAAAAGGSPVLTPPLATTTWTARYRRFAYLGFDWWLEYDPSDGAYGLHRCGHERWRVGLPPLCSPLCPTALGCGTLSDLSGDVTLLYLGHDALLSVHRLTGAYALLRLERSPARLVAPPAAVATDGSPAADLTMATLSLGSAANAAAPAADLEAAEGAGLRGTLPALAGREIAYLGNELLLALDDDSSSVGGASGGGNALFFLLCRNASEVAARRSPLRAVLAAPPTTSAALVSTFTSGAAAASARSQLPSGRRLIGLGGGRVLRLAPRAASGFAYEMFECAPSPCVADDCLGPAAPTGGEVKCASVGAGEVARAAGSLSDGSAPTAAQRGLTGRLTSLEAKATPPDELNAARRPTVSGAVSGALVADGAGAAPVTALGGSSSNGVPLPLSAVLPPRTHGGGVVGRTQWLRLDGDGSVIGGDALLEYESTTGGVRLRQLTMPSDVPIATLGSAPPPAVPASAGATLASGALGGAAAGTSCDSLPLLPYLTAPWAFPAHRLHSLGRAMVLDVDPLTAIFRVWKCDGALPAAILPTVGDAPITPPITTKARPSVPCVAIDNGVWPPLASHEQAVWLGDALGDAVLLFAPLSGAYEVWPVRQIAARVMPRPGQRALAAGVWAELLGCTLHHAGGSTLVALRPNTGYRYQQCSGRIGNATVVAV